MKQLIHTEIKRLIKATGYSWNGLKAAFQSEPAFRIEIFAAPFLILFALLGNYGVTKKAVLIGAVFLVLIAELCNTAIEAIVDRISEEHHPLSGKAKDVGSAIVFVALLNALLVWGIILL